MYFRIILFLGLVATISMGINWIAVNEGSVEFFWLGYQVKTSMGFFIFAGSVIVLMLLVIFQLLFTIVSLPKRLGKRYQGFQLEQNLRNLQVGYAALLSGDYEQARKFSGKLIAEPSKNKAITNLSDMLAAKLAIEEGNTAIAQDYFDKFMENKKQKFFAVKAMLDTAFAQGRIDEAMHYAEEAYRLKPNVKDGARSLLELYKKAGRFDRAEEFLYRYKRKHYFIADKYNNIDADKELSIVWLARAKDIYENDKSIRIKDRTELTNARKYAEKAMKGDPYNKEMVLLLLKIYKKLKLENKAKDMVEKRWYKIQSTDMGLAYLDVFSGTSHKDATRKKLKALENLGSISANKEILERLKDKIYDVRIEY